MTIDLMALLVIGFGLGLLHALDADHVMAVSVMSAQKRRLVPVLRQSGLWALGHGGVLLACGCVIYGLGINIPSALQRAAELGVGLVLIILGCICVYRFRRENIQLLAHTHGDIEHTHWQYPDHIEKRQHTPVLIGMLHGLAGSAPALALIPAVSQGQFLIAVIYLVIFSAGVLLSILFFGLGFAGIQHFIGKRYQAAVQTGRYLLAFASIALGCTWFVSAL